MRNYLSKDIIFVKEYEPYDFINMGQLAVQIRYTDGDTDMLTTPSTNPNCNDEGDFKNNKEFFDFIRWLDQQGIKKR